MKWFKNILFFMLLALLCVPLVQQLTKVVEVEPLSGAYNLPDTVPLTGETWFEGEFQGKYSPYYEYVFGFRPVFVRLRNQLHFWLYHESTNTVVPGEDDQLFAWGYWADFRGFNRLAKDSLEVKMKHLAMLQDSLQKMNKPMLLVIAPNKVRYMPEHLPRHFEKEAGEESNYAYTLDLLKKYELPVLDLNGLFLKMKDTVSFPLFANTSTHWSGYGMNLGMKYMIDTLEKMSGDDLKNIRFSGWALRDSSLSSDRDMGELMNLLFPYDTEPLAFPQWNLQGQDSAQKTNVLLIGDSFFWNYYAWGEMFEIFDMKTRFWYYNNTQMDLEQASTPVEELSAREAIKNADYVVILATEANLHLFPYGFPEKYLSE